MTDGATATTTAAADTSGGTTISSTAAALNGGATATATDNTAAQIVAAADAAQGKGAPSPISWLPDAPAELVGYVQNKGWTDPKQVLEGYQNLEKLRGVPAERLLTLPAADADDAAKGAFFEKLGRPKDVAGYEFKLGEQDNAYDAGLKQSFFKHGVTADQAKGIISDYAAIAEAQTKAQADAIAQRTNADHIELMREWGAAAQQNLMLAKKGADMLGLAPEVIDKIASEVGHKAFLKTLHDLASRAGEASFVSDTSAQGYGNVMTPGQAKAKLAELQADSGFREKIFNGDKGALEERRRLIAFAEAGQ